MEYRTAGIADCEALTHLRMQMRRERDTGFREELLYDDTLAFFQRNLKSGRHIAFVCEDDGKIAATAGLSLFEMPPTTKLPNGKAAKLMNMYVLPEYRHRGIAGAMLQFVLDYAREHECGRIMLNASPMGKKLYEAHGFRIIENEYELDLDEQEQKDV